MAITTSIAVLTALLATVTGVPGAAAADEVVQFQQATSNLPEDSPPVINLLLTGTEPLAEVVVTVSAVPSGTDPAEAGDFALNTATVTFPALSASGTVLPVDLSYTADTVFENPEELTLTITNVSVGAIGAPNPHVATIANDDPTPTLDILDAAIDEAAGSMLFTVRRNGLTELTATALATPASGTATATVDFDASPGAVSIAAGGPTGTDTFAVPIVDDGIYEPNETFTVGLSGLGDSNPGDISATGTINDDDNAPTLSVDDVTVNEADGVATFTVTRTGQTAFTTEVDITTNTASAVAGDDFTGVSDTLSITPGGPSGTATLDVTIIDDDIDEDIEMFTVGLSNQTNATLSDSSARGSITDDDTAGIVVDLFDSLFVLEGGAADTFTVVLTSEPAATVTIDLADALGEVTVAPTQLAFTAASWDQPQTVSVNALEDGLDEEDPHQDQIGLTAGSTDPKYDNYPLSDVAVSIGDADALLVSIDGPTLGVPGRQYLFSAMVNAGGTGTIIYEWTVVDPQGNPIVTGDEATFAFTPSNGGTFVVRSLVSDTQGQSPAQFIQFKVLGDIADTVFVDDILWMAQEGITLGCNPPANDEFCPAKTVTRGQMAAFLVRFLGLTAIDGSIAFTDTATSVFEQDILKLATAGITTGCNADGSQFCPNKGVTRGQMAAFLVRALGLTDDGGGNLFGDDDTSVFETDIDKLATAEITLGCNPPTNSNFCPTKTVTRGQMAAFLHRAQAILDD
jgi:hypothetical protein